MSYKHCFQYTIFEEEINITSKLLKEIKSYSLTKDETNNNNFLKKDKKLLSMIKKNLQDIFKKHKLNIIDCWIQLYLKNDYHSIHTHFATQKDYSFVWFIDGDKNSSPIIFHEIGYPLINNNRQIKFDFKPGTLLIFPGFMPHEVPLNKSNNRLIVSGNAI
jgi:hypothetical protein|tara:strand:- start:1509 stop:1991 length:483 start_codon:yes stop_codon:yes gene_type:complete